MDIPSLVNYNPCCWILVSNSSPLTVRLQWASCWPGFAQSSPYARGCIRYSMYVPHLILHQPKDTQLEGTLSGSHFQEIRTEDVCPGKWLDSTLTTGECGGALNSVSHWVTTRLWPQAVERTFDSSQCQNLEKSSGSNLNVPQRGFNIPARILSTKEKC